MNKIYPVEISEFLTVGLNLIIIFNIVILINKQNSFVLNKKNFS